MERRQRHIEHMQRWREEHGHDWEWPPSPERRRRWRLRRYVSSRLHRRIFVWFGFSILISGGVGYLVYQAMLPSEKAILVAAAVSAALVWMSAGGVSRYLTRPLVQLVTVTRDIGEGKLDSRMKLGLTVGDEVGVLARSVNGMAERIEEQLADQRELLAAVSHELRTPLGHIRVLVDTAREGSENQIPLDEIEREVVEVDRLVDQLLATSRLDFGELEKRALDGVELAVRALERLGVDASLLDVQSDESALEVDPTLVLAAITNLILNAQTHGGGLIRLVVKAQGDKLHFEAWDEGPGFEDEDAERVFESFYRGENKAGGSLGLGLSLVRRIAVAHGGDAWAENRDEVGARVGFSVSR
jgi:signal transduction histidine kinase